MPEPGQESGQDRVDESRDHIQHELHPEHIALFSSIVVSLAEFINDDSQAQFFDLCVKNHEDYDMTTFETDTKRKCNYLVAYPRSDGKIYQLCLQHRDRTGYPTS